MADGLPRASSHACASTQGEVEKGLRGEARLRLPAKHAVRSLIGVEIDRSAWKERLLRITHEAHWTGRRPPHGREAGRSFPLSPDSGSPLRFVNLGGFNFHTTKLTPTRPSIFPGENLICHRTTRQAEICIECALSITFNRPRRRCCIVVGWISLASPDWSHPTSASAAVLASGRNPKRGKSPLLAASFKFQARRAFLTSFNNIYTLKPIFIASNVH